MIKTNSLEFIMPKSPKDPIKIIDWIPETWAEYDKYILEGGEGYKELYFGIVKSKCGERNETV